MSWAAMDQKITMLIMVADPHAWGFVRLPILFLHMVLPHSFAEVQQMCRGKKRVVGIQQWTSHWLARYHYEFKCPPR